MEEIKRYTVEFFFDNDDDWEGSGLFMEMDAEDAERLMDLLTGANPERLYRLPGGGHLVNLKKVKFIKLEPVFEEEEDINS